MNWFHMNCMQDNPDKFQAIAVGKKTYDKYLTLKISGSEIKCEKLVKLLGLIILTIISVCRIIGQQLYVLKRLSPYLSKLNKLLIFFIHLYCPILIIALLHGTFAQKISPKSYKRFKKGLYIVCFVYEDFNSSYEELLIKANISSLHIRRLQTIAIETLTEFLCIYVLRVASGPRVVS